MGRSPGFVAGTSLPGEFCGILGQPYHKRRNVESFATWAEFKKCLNRQVLDYEEQLKLQLSKRKLIVGESLEDYFNAISGLCDKVNRDVDDDDVIVRPRNGLCSEMLAKLTMSQAKTPMQFLSEMQRVNDSLRLVSRNRSQSSQATELKTVHRQEIVEQRAARANDRPRAPWRCDDGRGRKRTTAPCRHLGDRKLLSPRRTEVLAQDQNLVKNRPSPVTIVKARI